MSTPFNLQEFNQAFPMSQIASRQVQPEMNYNPQTVEEMLERKIPGEEKKTPKGGASRDPGTVSPKQYRRALEGSQRGEMNGFKEKALGAKSKISKMSGQNKFAALAALGLKMGVTHSLLDNDDDGVVSTVATSAVYTAGIGGAAVVANKYLNKVEESVHKKKLWDQQIKKFETDAGSDEKKIEELKKRHGEERGEELRKKKGLETKEERIKKATTTKNQGNIDTHEERVVKRGKQVMKGSKIAMGVIAVGGALSALHGMKRSSDVEDIKKDGEKKITLEKRAQKEKNRNYGYNDPSFGNIAFEMFEQRTGHYKMGDSKFQ